MDAVMLDRLMSKAANHIYLLAAPGTLDKTFDIGERDFEQIVELSQRTVPLVILDIPHCWNAWVKHTLAAIDEIVIVAEPDLASLRNAKNLSDVIKTNRPTESDPLLVINKLGVPRRPEIGPGEFASSIDCRLVGQIPFDAGLFGTAANNGQMIAEVSAGSKINDIYRSIGFHVTGRAGMEQGGKAGGKGLPNFMKLLKKA
jgi:pilus assembly protein CpaE